MQEFFFQIKEFLFFFMTLDNYEKNYSQQTTTNKKNSCNIAFVKQYSNEHNNVLFIYVRILPIW